MKKNYSFLFFLILKTMTGFSQPANNNISNTSFFAGEPYLAVNPSNHQNIVIAWMALDFSTGFRVAIKSKVSFDGGNTWGNQYIQPHFGATWQSADVCLQYRPNGTLYLTYIDYREAPDSGGVYITHSKNGGITWTLPTRIWNGLTEDPSKRPFDRPWLAIDNSATSNGGAFYMTTKPAPWIAAPNRPYLKTSLDSGQTWSNYRNIDTINYLVGNIAAPMAFPTVSADGALCIAYPSYLTSQFVYPKYLLAKSYNRGASFLYYDLFINPVSVTNSEYKLGYRLAANPSNANQLAFAFIAQTNGDPDVFLTTTNNGGISWNKPVRVNDDLISNGKGQDMVWVNYDNNNKLVLTWRDRRNGTGSGFYQSSDTYCAVSTDNGNTFQTNVRLSNATVPFDSILTQSGNDFLSNQFLNDTIYSAWGDVRTGKLNIFFTKTAYTTGTGLLPININEGLFSIYPNPASNKLNFTYSDNKIKKLEIKLLNATGQEVLSKEILLNSHEFSLDVSHLLPGIYFVNIIADKQKQFEQTISINK